MDKCMILVFLGLTLRLEVNASPKRSHGAHVHGSATMDIAIDGDHASLQFVCDTHSLYGFEHIARTPTEKTLVRKTMKLFNESFSENLIFEKRLNCTFLPKLVQARTEGHDDDEAPGEQHQSLFADYEMKCQTDIEPSVIQVDFTKTFPQILSIKLQVVSSKNNISQTLKGKDRITLK
jgi:hypothetical protein